MSGAFFRGTNLAQDQRFGDATQKLISQTTFSSVLKKRVDMSKVNMEVIKPWISRKINELLGIEDEVLFEYIVNLLQESNTPDGKAMQVNLTGFLESKTVEFMQSLWTLLLEAQKGLGGVPESLIRGKVEEVRQQRVEQERIRDRIRTADERVREEPRDRKTRSGKKSRWDAPALTASVAESTTESRDRGDSDRRDRDSDRRHSRERRDRDRGHRDSGRHHSRERRHSRERSDSDRDRRHRGDRRRSRERSTSPLRERSRR
ncbi:Serine/arginine repetitive matrix protein 1 [Coemansia aciculifera]|nr:Serine/arginine repetitive matrix protein 1 [Coemansia aciculifera]